VQLGKQPGDTLELLESAKLPKTHDGPDRRLGWGSLGHADIMPDDRQKRKRSNM
jgi:hypothetical protein